PWIRIRATSSRWRPNPSAAREEHLQLFRYLHSSNQMVKLSGTPINFGVFIENFGRPAASSANSTLVIGNSSAAPPTKGLPCPQRSEQGRRPWPSPWPPWPRWPPRRSPPRRTHRPPWHRPMRSPPSSPGNPPVNSSPPSRPLRGV